MLVKIRWFNYSVLFQRHIICCYTLYLASRG